VRIQGGDSNAGWAAHRAEIGALPESVYHHDRFRAIRGRVMDEDGKPVVGALVRCVKVESLVELAREWLPTSSGWKLPVEAEISTGDDGKYEFAHLPIGTRTFFYSAPGRDLAPAIKDLIVVQDGLGAQLDVTLARPKVLRVRLGWSSIRPTPRFHLIPHRWWPDIITVPVARGADSVEFRGLGGPFRKGLIAVSAAGGLSPLRVIARYDLDRHENITLPRPGDRASRFDIPEAGGLEPLDQPLTPAVRLFYAALSPIALFWVPDVDIGPLRLPLDELVRSIAAHARHGAVRGFSPNPLLPVLVRSASFGDVLGWTSEASEFEVGGLSAGIYRARAMDLFGSVTFASGARAGSAEHTRLWSRIDMDQPNNCEVMGAVQWESGAPAAKAAVFMQNTLDFRRFVRRVETNEDGFFRFENVPRNEPYFTFALPPGQTASMRNLHQFAAAGVQREIWRDQTLHPHRVSGSLALASPSGTSLQLIRVDGKAEAPVWGFRADSAGRFTVENVPHGRYRVRVGQVGGQASNSSIAFDVGDGRTESNVEWPSD
jgi:Carboxypeptidase regulatory-like domain